VQKRGKIDRLLAEKNFDHAAAVQPLWICMHLLQQR
jgi:hypothetical protein